METPCLYVEGIQDNSPNVGSISARSSESCSADACHTNLIDPNEPLASNVISTPIKPAQKNGSLSPNVQAEIVDVLTAPHTVSRTNEGMEIRHLETSCPEYVGLNLVNNTTVRGRDSGISNNGFSGTPSVLGSAGHPCFESSAEELCHCCVPASVRASMDGVDFLMDVGGKPTRFPLSSNAIPIRLFCMECGMVFKSNDEVETHHANAPCPEDARLKLLSGKHAVLCCNDCGNAYARLSGHCHRCSPAPEAPSADLNSTLNPCRYSPQYCFKCLQVFYSTEDEQDHEAECVTAEIKTDEDRSNQDGQAAIVFGKGALGNHQVEACKIDDCGMVFVEAPSLTEGLYQHSHNVHNISPHKDYAIHPETLRLMCILCGIKKGASGHCLDTVGDFLKAVYNCSQAKKAKRRRNPPLAMKFFFEISIPRDLDASRWHQRLEIHTKDRSDGQNSGRKSRRNRGPREAPQAEEPAAGGKPVNRKYKVAENETGAIPAATKKPPVKRQSSRNPVSTEAAVGPLSTGPVPGPASDEPIVDPVSAEPDVDESNAP